MPAAKEKGKGSVSRRELRVRGTGDDEIGERPGKSASFESTIGKLGRVSGQTGFLRQRLMREDRVLP